MKFPLKVPVVVLTCLLLSSCLNMASRSYQATENNVEVLNHDVHNIDHIEPLRSRVSSQKIWQNTRVFIQRGDTVTIIANGRWSPWPAMALWSGPDGNSFWAAEVPGIPGSALMARLGHQGQPFEIGSSRSFRARDYGMLYLAMNDPFKALHDNKGDMNAEIYIDARSKLRATGGSGAAPTYRVTAYSYDDQTRRGYISVQTGGQSFAVRQWLLDKIGEIASSKNIALDARKNRAEGGAYRVTNEKVANGVLSIEFETIW